MIATMLNLLLPIVMAATPVSMEVTGFEAGDIGETCGTIIIDGTPAEVCEVEESVRVRAEFYFVPPVECRGITVNSRLLFLKNGEGQDGIYWWQNGRGESDIAVSFDILYERKEIVLEITGSTWWCEVPTDCRATDDGSSSCKSTTIYSGEVSAEYAPLIIPSYEDWKSQ